MLVVKHMQNLAASLSAQAFMGADQGTDINWLLRSEKTHFLLWEQAHLMAECVPSVAAFLKL